MQIDGFEQIGGSSVPRQPGSNAIVRAFDYEDAVLPIGF